MNDLDSDYIKKYNLLETDSMNFYKEIVEEITLNFIYINENKEIYKTKSKREKISDSSLTKERLLYIIKSNQYNLYDKHRLVDLIKFNINIDSSEIQDFILSNGNNNNNNNNYIKSLKIIDDITFNDTIKMLEKQNSLIFIFTKYIKTDINTRRIKINTHKKTRRKQ